MENNEFEKSKAFSTIEVLDYIPDSVVIKTILKKITGSINIVSFDTMDALKEKISPFDTFIQIIDGRGEIVIDDKSNLLEAGQSIVVPAHSRNTIRSNIRFKMLLTIIKSGYEDLPIEK